MSWRDDSRHPDKQNWSSNNSTTLNLSNENFPPLSSRSSYIDSSIQKQLQGLSMNKKSGQFSELDKEKQSGGNKCRVLFSLKHVNNEHRPINRPLYLEPGTKVYDAIYQLLSNIDWPQNQQYSIDLVSKKNKEEVLDNDLIENSQNYIVIVSGRKNVIPKVLLKVNDTEPQRLSVARNSTVLELVTLAVHNVSNLESVEKYDNEFEQFVDCEMEEVIEDGGRYKVQVEFFNQNEITNNQMETKSVLSDTTVSSIAYSKPPQKSPVKYPDLSILEEMPAEMDFVCVPKYQEIDESKNINRVPTSKPTQIGSLFDLMTEEMNGKVLDREELSDYLIENERKYEVKTVFHKGNKTFSGRCEQLGITGIQKITALVDKQSGLFDYLIAPVSEELKYCTVVLTCIGKTFSLDTKNERLRDKLSNSEFGPSTHLLASVTKGLVYTFLIGFPEAVVKNMGAYQLEKTILDLFNYKQNINLRKLHSAYGTQIFVFSNNSSMPVKTDATFAYVEELVQKLNTSPELFVSQFKDINWTLAPLDQFQQDFKLQLPIEMPPGLLDQPIELLVEIERRLDAYELLYQQVDEYERIFSKEEFGKWFEIYKSEETQLNSAKQKIISSILKHRQSQLSDDEFFIELSEHRQQSQELPDDEFHHIYHIEEKIKEVAQWEKLGLFFIGDDEVHFHHKIISPTAYVLVYNDKNDMTFKQNLRHMKTLAPDVTRLLLDLNLYCPKEIPTNFTGILKFENGELVDLDVLRSFNFRLRSSVARCPKSELRKDLTPSEKLSNLEIPCPLCDDEDCFWSCDRCLKPLQYDWDGFLCCECGMAIPEVFEFWCKNYRKHGETYEKFKMDQLEDCLQKLRSFKDKTILVLGQTGVGKFTWINSIAHYLTYGSLDDALDGEPMHLVPSSFTIIDENLKKVRVVVGEEDDAESFKQGESATRAPKIHSFDYKGGKLLLIDTPGVGDTRGFDQDKKNFSMTLDYISSFKELHGICIFLKPNEARLTPPLRYCISQLFSHLHRNAAKNIVFCLTNTQGTLYKPGETFSALEEFLGELQQNRGIDMRLTHSTIYCVDNCSFRYLCAKRQGIQFDDNVHANYSEAWNKSWSETYRLIRHITEVKPHSATETATLNEARRIILSLAKPLALITKEIQLNVSCTEQHKFSVQGMTGDEQDFRSKLKIRRYYVKAEALPYPRTVCVDRACVEVKKDREGNNLQVFSKACHDHCYLRGVSVQTYPTEALIHCTAMGGSQNCRQCSHSWNVHMHLTWYHTEESEEVDDETVKRDLQSVSDKKKAKLDIIRKCEQMINDYKQEQKQINTIAARFAAFLQANAIILYNDAIKEYINIEINNAKIEAAITEDFSKVEGLQRALSEYLEEKKIIQQHVSQSKTSASAADLAFELEDIRSQFDVLYNLPLTGANIKKMLDLELNGQQKQVEYQQGHFNTYNTRSKANNKYNSKPKDPITYSTATLPNNDYSHKNKKSSYSRQSSSSRIPFLSTVGGYISDWIHPEHKSKNDKKYHRY